MNIWDPLLYSIGRVVVRYHRVSHLKHLPNFKVTGNNILRNVKMCDLIGQKASGCLRIIFWREFSRNFLIHALHETFYQLSSQCTNYKCTFYIALTNMAWLWNIRHIYQYHKVHTKQKSFDDGNYMMLGHSLICVTFDCIWAMIYVYKV